MKHQKALTFKFIVIFGVFTLFIACGADQKESQGTVIKESTFKVTPLQAEVYSKDEHVSVTISDILNLEKLGLSSGDLLDYNIYLYVHPLNADGWWRQNPATANTKWTAQAYLGGIGQYSAIDGEVFEIAALLAGQTPPDRVANLGILREMTDIHLISEIRQMTVRR
jgi:hypothetical protein